MIFELENTMHAFILLLIWKILQKYFLVFPSDFENLIWKCPFRNGQKMIFEIEIWNYLKLFESFELRIWKFKILKFEILKVEMSWKLQIESWILKILDLRIKILRD